MATQNDVRRIVSGLPGVNEGTGRFGFDIEVKGKRKGFCWSWMERVDPKKPRVENPAVLAIRVPDLADKEALHASDPVRRDSRQTWAASHFLTSALGARRRHDSVMSSRASFLPTALRRTSTMALPS